MTVSDPTYGGYGRPPPTVRRENSRGPSGLPEALIVIGALIMIIPVVGAFLGWSPIVFDSQTLFYGIFIGCGIALLGILCALAQRIA